MPLHYRRPAGADHVHVMIDDSQVFTHRFRAQSHTKRDSTEQSTTDMDIDFMGPKQPTIVLADEKA